MGFVFLTHCFSTCYIFPSHRDSSPIPQWKCSTQPIGACAYAQVCSGSHVLARRATSLAPGQNVCSNHPLNVPTGFNLSPGQYWMYRSSVCHYQSYLLHMISKPSQKSRTFTSEMIAQFLQFTKSTSWSPNSWLKASGFQSSDLSFLCTPETSTGCRNKNTPIRTI